MDHLQFKQLRKESGLTQSEVADELGVDKQTVCRWERGRHGLRRVVTDALVSLVNDEERVAAILNQRPARVRGRPFQKKQ